MDVMNVAAQQSTQGVRQTTADQILGKDEFLKILITQLNYQDPLNPMEDRDFITQMAQFSSLEQMLQMNQSFTLFLNHQLVNNFSNQTQLIGKQVQWQEHGDLEAGSGVVQSVSIKDGHIYAETEAGERVDITHIFHVEKVVEL